MVDRDRYGHIRDEDEGYPLAAWIWGHRLRIGQHWMEYLLEFLNVLAGYGYRIGSGINVGEYGDRTDESYKCFTRLGLRRFVFYDSREKTRHPDDDAARLLLLKQLAEQKLVETEDTGQDALDLSRTLLRSLSAVEEQRSWYAKFLFPIHNNLMFWEALRKGATKYLPDDSSGSKAPYELDANIEFDSRNFFARGGEIYYLILSAGTRDRPDLRESIAGNLFSLLNNRNRTIGRLADSVDSVWRHMTNEEEESKEFTLGWICDPTTPFYSIIAEDVYVLLQAELDPLETLDLLAHLIGFHLTLYIYYHASPLESISDRSAFSFPATLLVDALGGADGGVLRRVSALLYQEQEARIVLRAEKYVTDYLETIADRDFALIDSDARRHFSISRLGKASRDSFNRDLETLYTAYGGPQASGDFFQEYSALLTSLLMADFRKNFLGVHRKLSKAVGFVSPPRGANSRYVLGDNLLKALVVANISSDQEMVLDEFLDRLYARYGLIIGPVQARSSGLYERQHINSEYYDQNRRAFLEKLRHSGLAQEYSDATAMVKAW